MSGNLETKYKVKELGLTFTEKWNTDNTLNTTVDIQDKLLPGLKVSQLKKENLFLINTKLIYIFCLIKLTIPVIAYTDISEFLP